MGLQSLRDKLLQAGIVTQEQAKKAEADLEAQRHARPEKKRPPAKAPPRTPPPKPRELTAEERIAAEEAAAHKEKERLLQREREENRKRALEDRKRQETLRALATEQEIAERGDEPFHYASRKNRLLRIYLSSEQVRRLEAGELAIIEKPLPAEIGYALVNRETAEKALALDRKALRFYNRAPGETFGFRGEAPVEGSPAEAPEEAPEPADG